MADDRAGRELTEIQKDALREVGSIGAGNAATALNHLTKRKVAVTVSRIRMIPLQEVPNMLGGPEVPVAGVQLRVEKGFEGNVLLLLEKESAYAMADLMIPEGLEGGDEEVVRKSALQELGSILTGAYLSALSSLTGMMIKPSIAGFAMDMAGAVMNSVLAELDPSAEDALVIETEFKVAGEKIEGRLVLFPQVGTLDGILERLGVPFD